LDLTYKVYTRTRYYWQLLETLGDIGGISVAFDYAKAFIAPFMVISLFFILSGIIKDSNSREYKDELYRAFLEFRKPYLPAR